MKKTLIPVFILIVSWTDAMSQELSSQVLVPLASVVYDWKGSYSQTVGEPVIEMVRYFDNVLTQGFQQPSVKVPKYDTIDGTGIKIYPNPVTDYMIIELYGERAKTILIEIYKFHRKNCIQS